MMRGAAKIRRGENTKLERSIRYRRFFSYIRGSFHVAGLVAGGSRENTLSLSECVLSCCFVH